MSAEQQLEDLKKRYIGKRIKIIEPGHPWEDEIGIFKDIQYFHIIGKWAVIVELTNQCDHTAAVFSGGRGIKIV